MRPRFSLRTLLVLTAVLAAGCYWWVAGPAIIAERFVESLKVKDPAQFLATFTNSSDRELGSRIHGLYHFPAFYPYERHDPTINTGFTVERSPRSWTDLIYARRRMQLTQTWLNLIMPSGITYPVVQVQATAGPRGVRITEHTLR